jgi:hypothetical protein
MMTIRLTTTRMTITVMTIIHDIDILDDGHRYYWRHHGRHFLQRVLLLARESHRDRVHGS